MAEQFSYDGFISYSHAADGLLAPRLQAGLQRFAKAWWKRRALRLFRDESSLSANPHLWSSIAEALDTSGWFVLLLSPDAAQSEWVAQEIEYWITNRDPSRILPVVTDGEFGWAGGDVVGDAVPAALRGVFSEEPRWVDLRWAKDEDQLDLQDPRFADAVADIGSAIRGVPKDELASEEVRQHRRTVRTAWAAGVGLVALAMIAGLFGVASSRNASEAVLQAELAAQNALEAEAARDTADENAAEAATQRDLATAESDRANAAARLARSRELSGAALSVVEEDPELATRLVVYAASLVEEQEQPAAVVDAMWAAGVSNRLVDVADLGATLYTSMTLSNDGETLAAALENESIAFPGVLETGRLAIFEAATMDLKWEWTPGANEGVSTPTISPDGALVAVGTIADPGAEEPSSAIEVFELASGDPVTTIPYQGCEVGGAPAFSPDGSILAVTAGYLGCPRPESTTARWVELFDTTTWQSIRIDELPASSLGSFPQWTNDGRLYVFGDHLLQRYTPDFRALETLEGIAGFGDVSPDGRLVASFNLGSSGDAQSGFAVFDSETLERKDLLPWDAFPRFPSGIRFTDDSRSLFVGAEGANTTLYDVGSGSPTLSLPTPETDTVVRDDRSGRIYTSHPDGTIMVWNAISAAYGLELLADLGTRSWVNGANTFSAGDGVTGFIHLDPDGFTQAYASFFDQASGLLLGEPIPVRWGAHAVPDGRFVIQLDPNTLALVDPHTGASETIYESEDEFWYSVSLGGTEIAVGVQELDDLGQLADRWMVTIDLEGNVVDEPDLGVWPEFDDQVVVTFPTRTAIAGLARDTGEELWREDPNFFATQITSYGIEGIGANDFAVIDISTGGEVAVDPR